VVSDSPPAHVVSLEESGETLAALVRRIVPGVSWNRARDLVRSGRVFVDGDAATDPVWRVVSGHEIVVRPTAPRRRAGALGPEAIVHADPDVVVVRKPAGVLTVPYAPDDRDTLVDQAAAALRRREGRRGELGVVQRLDKDTSGLVVFPRNLRAKRALQQQLRRRTVERRYLALVDGAAGDATHESVLVANRGDGLRGSHGRFRKAKGAPPQDARWARTHVEVLERLRAPGGGAVTLVACRLDTGRQHQIRIHLAEAGTPLLGERVYVRDRPGPPAMTAPRTMLHAETLGFDHPRHPDRRVRFRDPPPPDFQTILDGLRAGAPPR